MSDAFYDDENFSDEFVEADGSVDLSIWRQLLDYALVYSRDLYVLAGCAVMVALCEISFPLITKEVVDGVYEQGRDYPCLLYTSPSPRDKRQSRMPSSA